MFFMASAGSDRERGTAPGALCPPCLSLHSCPCPDLFVCLSSPLFLSRSPSLYSFAKVAIKRVHKNGGLKQEKLFHSLEASTLKTRCQQGHTLSESSRRESFLPLPASSGSFLLLPPFSGSLAVAALLQRLSPAPHGLLP